MVTTRSWGMGACLLVLGACADSVVSQGTLDCAVEGETRCDNTGGMEMVCAKDASGKLRFGTPTPCPGGRRCVSGKCPDLCGAPCTTPPDSCHKPLGTCWNGQCKYDPLEDGVACDDGNACTTGDACTGATCKGQATACASPPANTCKDGSTLTVHTTPGICNEGSCSYPSADVPCPLGCEAGACKGDPCKGVSCTSPPSACHKNPGSCLAGSCSYLADEGKGCNDNDACTTNDKCSSSAKCTGTAIACLTPPKNTCKNATTLTSYAKQGSCSKGVCGYPPTDVPCSHGCDSAAGACKGDPCAGITCTTAPAPTACYTSPGTCSDGKCSYAYADGKTCDDGSACTTADTCTTGKCAGNPVVCNSPPKSTCKDASTLTVYAAPGTCSATTGTCSYPSATVSCGFGCDAAAGICKGDPCATMTCTSPPNAQCYTTPGICSNGSCIYLPKAGASCDDGNPCTKTDVCSGTGTCAGTAYTCNDNLVCTKDTCNGTGGCTYPVDASSCLITIGYTPTCFQAGAFAPGNACRSCSPTKSQSSWTPASGTATSTASFDDGTLQGFTLTPSPSTSPVKWQLDTKRRDAGSHALYFGDLSTHTFDDPGKVVKGEATSPTVVLPATAKLCLEWRMYKDTEWGTVYDQLSVTALPAGTLIWKSGNEAANATTGGAFQTFIVDITSLAGSTVQFRFAFDSADEIANTGEGVYLDTIRVLKDCTP